MRPSLWKLRFLGGEADFRRSQKTTLLYTQNHAVVEDWDTPIVIDRSEFGAKQASVRVKNAGSADANLYRLSIRADVWYRAADYIYTDDPASRLSTILYRYFTGKKYKITGKTETFIPPGTFMKIDMGISGFAVPAPALSTTLDAEKNLFTTSWITVGDAAVDTSRYKSASYDLAAGAEYAGNTANARLDNLVNGSGADVGRPTM